MKRRIGHTLLIVALPQAALLPLVLVTAVLTPGDGYRIAWGIVAGIGYVISMAVVCTKWLEEPGSWLQEIARERQERERLERERQRKLDEQIGIPRPPR